MKAKFTYWIEPDGWHIGHLDEFPDYLTQGETLDDLEDHLCDLQDEVIPYMLASKPQP